MKFTTNSLLAVTGAAMLCSAAPARHPAIDLTHLDINDVNEFLENESANATLIEKRQGTGTGLNIPTTFKWSKVGNGDPHINYVITEIGGTFVDCSGGGTIAETEGHSISYSLSIEGPPLEWPLDAIGFSVEESTETSKSKQYTCAANGELAEICLLQYTPVLALSMQYMTINGPTETGPTPATAYLPIKNNVGSVLKRGVNFAQKNIRQCQGGNADRTINFHCGPSVDPDDGASKWFEQNRQVDGPWWDVYRWSAYPMNCPYPIEAENYGEA